MSPKLDDYHYCPACARRTRHRVVQDRVLAPVLWCLRCFTVHTGEAAATAPAPALDPVPASRVA